MSNGSVNILSFQSFLPLLLFLCKTLYTSLHIHVCTTIYLKAEKLHDVNIYSILTWNTNYILTSGSGFNVWHLSSMFCVCLRALKVCETERECFYVTTKVCVFWMYLILASGCLDCFLNFNYFILVCVYLFPLYNGWLYENSHC